MTTFALGANRGNVYRDWLRCSWQVLDFNIEQWIPIQTSDGQKLMIHPEDLEEAQRRDPQLKVLEQQQRRHHAGDYFSTIALSWNFGPQTLHSGIGNVRAIRFRVHALFDFTEILDLHRRTPK